MYKLTCKFCGSGFESRFPQGNVCNACKVGQCAICGKSFKKEWPYDQKTCSRDCRITYIQTKDNSIANSRRAATVKMRYGVTNVSELPEVRSVISATARKLPSSKLDELKQSIPQFNEDSKLSTRICKLCGDEFQGFVNQSYCSKPVHSVSCEVCGKQFDISNPANYRRTCSPQCKSYLIKQANLATIRHCAWCGSEFFASDPSTKYCNQVHYAECVICKSKFIVDVIGSGCTPDRHTLTCSSICATKLRSQTCLDRYGHEYATQNPEIYKKCKKPSYRCKTVDDNYVDSSWEQRIYNWLVTHNVPFVYQYPINYTLESTHTTFIDFDVCGTLIEVKGSHLLQGVYNDSELMDAKFSVYRHNNVTVVTDTEGLDLVPEGINKADISSIEDWLSSKFSNLADISINANSHNYDKFIKFLNDLSIPYIVMPDGCITAGEVTFCFPDSLAAVESKYVRSQHIVTVVCDTYKTYFGKPSSKTSNGLKYLSKCAEPLIGVDVSLFDDSPTFPYSNDRPKCFYNVKVDGNMSSYEAFYDKGIRWKMILNRIQYSGGFIDAKQVLNAMNVTRTCKQPSWFSASFACDIISKYVTADTIVDPFAGWGGRYEASFKLGKHYIGSDYNRELVNWHNESGRDIKYKDAMEVRYDKPCSVFICPPYSDPVSGRCFEDYNFAEFDDSAKMKSQCDWLKVVMTNIPNASEYIMVCKIVDSGFEPYVVDRKLNKSHFGENYEYIIVVPQSSRKDLI